VAAGDPEVHLTPIEYKLLTILVRHAGKVITHAQHHASAPEARSRADHPRYLFTEPRVGYRLATE